MRAKVHPAGASAVARRGTSLRAVEVGLVAAGGFVGTLARAAVLGAVPVAADGFPWPTLVVNVSGAVLLALLLRTVVDRRVLLLAGVGLLGSWTTFSTFAVEADRLAGVRPVAAAAYVVVTLVAGLAAVRAVRP